MSRQHVLARAELPSRISTKGFARLHRSLSSASPASSRGSSIDEKLYITLPKRTAESQSYSEPLFQECYLSSEEDLSPLEDCGDSLSLIDSDISDDLVTPVPSLPERLADTCPGRESEIATVRTFVSAGRAKIVSVQVPAAMRRSIIPSTSIPANSQLHRPTSSRTRATSSSAIQADSSRPSRSSSISCSAYSSKSSTTKLSSSSITSTQSQQTPLSSTPSTPSPSFLDFDPFANVRSCPPQPAAPRGHSRLRSLSQSISRSVLNMQLDQKEMELRPTPSAKKENRKSLQMAARGATQRLPAIEIPPYPVVGYEGAHMLGRDESKKKKLQNRKSWFRNRFDI